MFMWIILGVVIVIVIGAIYIYNSLVRSKVRVDEAWSDIDVQLKRRYDLIPNLVETVKGYAKHEKEVFEKVTEMRSQAMNANGLEEKGKAENMLSDTLKSLFAVAENYPQLKANENFLELQRELTDTEDKIQAARRFYNSNVRDLNTKIQVFPNSLLAGILGYKARDFFQTEESEKEQVKVDFNEK